jgi:hypothetical protein
VDKWSSRFPRRACLTRHKKRKRGAGGQRLRLAGGEGRGGFASRSSGSRQPLTLPRLSGGADRLVASRLGPGARFASDLKAEWPAGAVGAVVGIAASGPLVGRVAELAVLDEAIGSADARSAQVVAISGEGGIGKSRLASEGLQRAGARGFRTLESAAGPHLTLAISRVGPVWGLDAG